MPELMPTIEKKYQPRISFGIDKYVDIESCMYFWKRFRKARHEDLKIIETIDNENECRKIVEDFINKYYVEHSDKINDEVKEVEEIWRELEPVFYDKVEKLVGGYSWPKGDYRGFASVLRRFPRNIKQKTFSFPAENIQDAKIVIAHEMLHFIVYDYLEHEFHLAPSEMGDNDDTFWQFTENLNVLIENDPFWHEFTGGRVSYPYTNCEVLCKKMEKVWQQNKSVDNLVREILLKDKKE